MLNSTNTLMLEVPLWHMAVLLAIMIACLAWRRYAQGAAGAALFILYWGYVYNMDKFLASPFEFSRMSICFILTGAVNAILVLLLTLQAFACKD